MNICNFHRPTGLARCFYGNRSDSHLYSWGRTLESVHILGPRSQMTTTSQTGILYLPLVTFLPFRPFNFKHNSSPRAIRHTYTFEPCTCKNSSCLLLLVIIFIVVLDGEQALKIRQNYANCFCIQVKLYPYHLFQPVLFFI